MSSELKQVAQGCHTRVLSYSTYDVNGYRFRTSTHERERPNATTINSGLVTIGQDGSDTPVEYYGVIEEIIELYFYGSKPLKLMLFKCHWFHPFRGVRRDTSLGLVEVAHQSILPGNDPFIVAQQATQVYYIPYPCKTMSSLVDWWVVHKVQPYGKLPTPSEQDYNMETNNGVDLFFQEDGLPGTFEIIIGEEDDHMDDIQIDADEVVNQEDLELLNRLDIDGTEGDEVESTPHDSDDDFLEGPSAEDPIVDDYF